MTLPSAGHRLGARLHQWRDARERLHQRVPAHRNHHDGIRLCRLLSPRRVHTCALARLPPRSPLASRLRFLP
eukprot:2424930-Rhodomonas_salina.2